jgi:proliferating cell nuclear antigen
MNFKLNEAKTFKDILKSLVDLMDQVNIEFSEDGITIQSMDSSHVSLTLLQLFSSFFDEYKCDFTGSIGVSLVSMNKIIKSCANDSIIEMEIENKEADNIRFILTEKKKKETIDLRTLEIDGLNMGIPDIESDYEFKYESVPLQDIFRRLTSFSDTITFTPLDKEVRFSSKGKEADLKIDLECTEMKGFDSMETDDVKITFALKYFNFFMKASSLSAETKIFVSENNPCIFFFDLGNENSLKFYLAPKIDDE